MNEFTPRDLTPKDNPEKPEGRPIEHGRRGLEELVDNIKITKRKEKKPKSKIPQPPIARETRKDWEFELIMLFPRHQAKGYQPSKEKGILLLGSYKKLLEQCKQLGGEEIEEETNVIEPIGMVLTPDASLIQEMTITMRWTDYVEAIKEYVLNPREWIYLGLVTQQLHQDIVEIVRIDKSYLYSILTKR